MKLLTNTEFITAKLLGAKFITRDKDIDWADKVYFWKHMPEQQTEGTHFANNVQGWVYVTAEDDNDGWVGAIDAKYSSLDYGEEAKLDSVGGYEISTGDSTITVSVHNDNSEEEYDP